MNAESIQGTVVSCVTSKFGQVKCPSDLFFNFAGGKQLTNTNWNSNWEQGWLRLLDWIIRPCVNVTLEWTCWPTKTCTTLICFCVMSGWRGRVRCWQNVTAVCWTHRLRLVSLLLHEGVWNLHCENPTTTNRQTLVFLMLLYLVLFWFFCFSPSAQSSRVKEWSPFSTVVANTHRKKT